MKKLIIRKSSIQGKGIFTEYPIRKGSKVFKFSDRPAYFHKETCDCFRCQHSVRVSKNQAITPRKGSFGWSLNHSCDANCMIRGRNVIALRNINAGEELTIDYSMHIPDVTWSMKCLCGAHNCRKILKSIQSVPKNIFEKHRQFLSKFLQREYHHKI